MYKFVLDIDECEKSNTKYLRISHIPPEKDFYYVKIDEKILEDYEIVQGYKPFYRDRIKKQTK